MKQKIAALLSTILLLSSLPGCQDESTPPQDSQTSQSPIIENIPAAYSQDIWYRYNAQLAADPEAWTQARQIADVMVVTRNQLNNSTQDELNALIRLQKEHGVRIALEVKGVLASQATRDCITGKSSLAALSFGDSKNGEFAMVSRAVEAGLTADYLIFDNTLPLAMYPNGAYSTPAKRFMSPAEAAMETAASMQLWGKAFPDAQMIYQVDLFKYGWQNTPAYQLDNDSEYGDGDLHYHLAMLDSAARSMDVPLTSVLVNFPYDYVLGQFGDSKTAPAAFSTDWIAVLSQMEAYGSQLGMEFGLTLSSSKSGSAASGSSTRFFAASLRLLNRAAEAGMTPGYILYDRGETYPNVILPDSEDYSYTNALIRLAGQFKDGNPIDLRTVPTKIPPVVPENIKVTKVWSFDNGVDGWNANNGIGEFASKDGALHLTATTGDPYFSTDTVSGIRTNDAEYLYIRYLNVGIPSDSMQLFFTNGNGGFNEPMSIHFTMDEPAEDESWSEIYVNLRECSLYTGTLASMRLDPGNAAGKIIIDEIALYNKTSGR